MPRNIDEIISRRSDLGTFLVHLTREANGRTARDNLKSMLVSNRIDALTPMGAAVPQLRAAALPIDTQKTVCFTETPLENTHLLIGEIEGRQIQFGPYGIAVPKKMGRADGINPVWYLDITPGHTWLTNSVNHLVDVAIAAGTFTGSDIERLAPFIEQMGTGVGLDGHRYKKEFWWEREWRRVGNYHFPHRILLLCPEEEFPDFIAHVEAQPYGPRVTYLDPRWGIEQIISRTSGYSRDDTDIF